MTHIRGERFGLPAIIRAGCLKNIGTFPVEWTRHGGVEVHFVFKGQMTWEIHGAKDPLRLSGGMFAVIPPGTRHRALLNRGTPAFRAGFLLDDHPEDRLEGTGLTANEMSGLLATFASHGLRPNQMSDRLRRAARDFADALRLENLTTAAGKRHLRVLSVSLLDETACALEHAPKTVRCDPVIADTCRWMEEHAAEPLDTQRLIARSGYGRSRFFSLFLQSTGMTPNDYLTRLKIERAKRALCESSRPRIREIATACGFASASSFATIFRRYVGLSPRTFAAEFT